VKTLSKIMAKTEMAILLSAIIILFLGIFFNLIPSFNAVTWVIGIMFMLLFAAKFYITTKKPFPNIISRKAILSTPLPWHFNFHYSFLLGLTLMLRLLNQEMLLKPTAAIMLLLLLTALLAHIRMFLRINQLNKIRL